MIFWKKWTSTRKCGPSTHDFLKKVDLDLKMWTLNAWFSGKSELRRDNVDLDTWFSEKSGPQPENVDLLRMIFWKRWTSTWRMWTFTHDFLKKSGPWLENVDLLRMIFWKKVDLDLKMWTSFWKFGPFTHDFLKNVDLNLKNVDPYAWFSEKGGDQPETFGPFTHDFLKKADLDMKMWTFYAWFSEKGGPRPKNEDLLRKIFWKRWTSTWKMKNGIWLVSLQIGILQCHGLCLWQFSSLFQQMAHSHRSGSSTHAHTGIGPLNTPTRVTMFKMF